MAKRKKQKKSAKCPEPFNTLLDIAGAALIGYLSDKRKKKRGSKSKIDPYAATGVAMGLGKIKSTEDIIKLGGILGAMGAFDDESDYHANDNRYAWRLNCVDGSKYGIDPDDYETRDEYNEAIAECMDEDSSCESEIDFPLDLTDPFTNNSFDTESNSNVICRVICRVSRLDNGANISYYTGNYSVKVGDRVIVPNGSETAEGIVIAVNTHYSDKTNEYETILGVINN